MRDGARVAVGYPSGQREQTVNLSATAFEGSNPSPTMLSAVARARSHAVRGEGRAIAGVAQLVERKPSKLDVAGSSPVSRFEAGSGERGTRTGVYDRDARIPAPDFPFLVVNTNARVAQLVEHTLGKGEVIGSIPIASSGRRPQRL